MNIRTIALYAILAAAFASCTKTEQDVTADVQSEIAFDAPVVGNVTKTDIRLLLTIKPWNKLDSSYSYNFG